MLHGSDQPVCSKDFVGVLSGQLAMELKLCQFFINV